MLGRLVAIIIFLILVPLEVCASVGLGPVVEMPAGTLCISNVAPVDAVKEYFSGDDSKSLSECDNSLYIYDEIIEGDTAKLEIVKKWVEEKKIRRPRELRLNSSGGLMPEALRIGTTLANDSFWHDVPLVMVSTDTCASSCVIVMAGARTRLIIGDPKVGIHRPYDLPENFAKLSAKVQRLTYVESKKLLDRYFVEMGVLGDLSDDMWRVPSYDIRWLKRADLAQYGLDKSAPEIQEADIAINKLVCDKNWDNYDLLLQRCSGSISCLAKAIADCHNKAKAYRENISR